MLEFIVIITIAAIACFICEQLCKNAKPDSSDAFVQDWQALKNEIAEIPKGVQRLGWNALIPTIPLVGLICLVVWALTRS